MPTYEYGCRACGERLEVVQSFHDEPLTVCPACGGELRKLFGNVGIVFKGSGFYKTDSRAAASKTAASKTAGSKPEGSKSEDSGGTSSSSTSSDGAKSETSKGTGTSSEKAATPAGA